MGGAWLAPCAFSAVTPSMRAASYRRHPTQPATFRSMNEHDQQAASEADIVDVVTTVQERGLAYLWQAVTEQIADPDAMRAHVMMARTLLGSGNTYTRLLKDWVSKGYSV